MNRKKIIVPGQAPIIPMHIGLRGMFKAMTHRGDRVPIIETPWGKNSITNVGIDRALGVGATNDPGGYCVAGKGNAAPSPFDTNLESYAGKETTLVSRDHQMNNDPLNGALYAGSVVRAQFSPGAFGAAPVNITEAGRTFGQNTLASVGAGTQLLSRGLLIDGGGNPTAVAVQPDEYLDLFWQMRAYLPYDATGQVTLDIDGVPTVHDYTVRPFAMVPGGNAYAWQPMNQQGGGNNFTYYFPQGMFSPLVGSASQTLQQGSGVMSTGLEPPGNTSGDGFTTSNYRPQTMNALPYTNGNYYRDVQAVWTLTRGNVGEDGIRTVAINLGWTMWQVEFSPTIKKTAAKQLNLTFRLSMSNMP